MPTYEYKCPSCQDKINVMHSIGKTPFIGCVECKTQMEIGIGGGIAVHFKGSGFYETDYKGK